MAVHPPSITRIADTLARIGSDQACLLHETTGAYRCFLPDLTGFTSRLCTGPDRQRLCARAGSATSDLGRGFSPAGADCGYRAPLAPRLARPTRWYRLGVLRGGDDLIRSDDRRRVHVADGRCAEIDE